MKFKEAVKKIFNLIKEWINNLVDPILPLPFGDGYDDPAY